MAQNNLRAIREKIKAERGYTVEQICNMIGIPRATWYTLEKRQQSPSMDVYTKIAELYGYTIEELCAAGKEDK